MKTYFAPPDRVSNDEAYEHYQKIIKNQSVINIIQAIPEVIVVLNKFRQIIFANKMFLEIIGKKDVKDVIGLRPGEAVGCIHSDVNEAGCGTSKFCRYCGAVRAILESIQGREATEECKILTKDNKCFLLKVKTMPVEIDGITYTLFTIKDIKDEKAMKMYQKLLFIDINEIISEILIAIEVLKNEHPEDSYIQDIFKITKNAINLINKQKLLISAENNEISVFPVLIYSKDFLVELIDIFKNQNIKIDENSQNIQFESDVKLLSLVFENLIFSVFNSSEDNIILSSEENNGKVLFKIKSKKYIPPEIQYNLFKKELISKGSAEEIGSYLVKIITEWYLKGKLFYETDETKGTVFNILLNKSFII